jgi:uncharacterized membrane protein
MKWTCTAAMVVILVACGSGDLTLNEANPDIVAQKPSFAQVYPIFQRDCIPCHAGTDEDPDSEDEDDDDDDDDGSAARSLGVSLSSFDPGLESCRSILNNLDDIVKTIFVDNNMPPGAWPRLTSKEKLTIERWIDADPGGSCN